MRTSIDSVAHTPFAVAGLQSVRSLPVPPHRVHGTFKAHIAAACWIVPVPRRRRRFAASPRRLFHGLGAVRGRGEKKAL